MFYDLRKIYEGAHNTEKRPDTTGWKCPECGKEIPGEAAVIIGLLVYDPSRWYAAEVIGVVACLHVRRSTVKTLMSFRIAGTRTRGTSGRCGSRRQCGRSGAT